MANPVDPVISHHTSQERQPAAVPELPNNKPHQSPKQSHAEDHTEAEEQTGFRGGRSTTEQLLNVRILCEKYLQHQQDLYHFFIDIKVFDRVLACRFVGNHEEVQHQHKPYLSHQKPL